MTDQKRGQLISISEAIVDHMPTMLQWTDEQWAAHDARISAEREQQQMIDTSSRAKSKRSRLATAGFPLRAVEVAESANASDPLIQRVLAWDPNVTSVLVLSGSKGCGKTVAATSWATRQRETPVFVRASTFAASSRYDRETRAGWFAASAMVLDDLGAEYLDAKGSFLVDLDELIDVYYGDKRPLLITTNCTKSIFSERYGDRITDRLRECASWFAASGDSRRGRKT